MKSVQKWTSLQKCLQNLVCNRKNVQSLLSYQKKLTKLGVSTENSTKTESVMGENPIQSKWGFEKCTKLE